MMKWKSKIWPALLFLCSVNGKSKNQMQKYKTNKKYKDLFILLLLYKVLNLFSPIILFTIVQKIISPHKVPNYNFTDL